MTSDRRSGVGARHYRRASIAGLFNSGSSKGLALVNLWLWNQLLSQEDFGAFMFALAIAEVLAMVATAGLDQGIEYELSRRRSADRGLAGAALGSVVGIGVATGVVVILVASAVGGEYGGWLVGLSLLIPVRAANLVVAGWRRSQMDVAEGIVLERTLPSVIRTAMLGIAVLLSMGAVSVVAAEILAPIMAALPFWIRDRLNPLNAVTRPLPGTTFGYSARLFGARILQRALDRSDVMMLGLLASGALLAEYAVAARVAALALFAHEILGLAFTSRAGRLFGNHEIEEARREYRRIQTLAVTGAMVVAMVLGGIGPWALDLVGEYAAAYPVMLVLLLAHLTKVGFGPSGVYLKMSGRAGSAVALAAAVLGANILLNLWLIPRWGVLGAAGATVAAILATNVVVAELIRRFEGFRVLTSSMGVTLLLAFCVVLGGLLGAWNPVVVGVAFGGIMLLLAPTAVKSVRELGGSSDATAREGSA